MAIARMMAVGLSISKTEFDSKKQVAFREGIAGAAGVEVSKVVIQSIESVTRRAGGIKINLEVEATSRPTMLCQKISPPAKGWARQGRLFSWTLPCN